MDEEIVGQTELPESDPVETEVTESEDGQSEIAESDQVEEEFDEVDYDGKKYSVPKELKDAFLRQSDYTRKTQEVAEQRRAIEQQALQVRQELEIQQRHIETHAQLVSIDNTLKQFDNVDWQAYSDQDPVAAQKSWFTYQQMQQTRNDLTQKISQAEQQRQFQTQQSIARQLEEGHKELAREIKGWSPEKAKELKSYALKTGLSESQIAGITDPKAVQVLHKAYLYDQMMSKAVQKPETDIKPTPVTKVGQKAGSTKDPDKMTTEEWVKWRDNSLRKRA
jgi:hypothetical protein